MRLGIAITRAAHVEPGWSTAHIACAALAAGHEVRFFEPWDFEVDGGGRVVARAHAFDAPQTREQLCNALVRREARRCYVELARLDLMLLRLNPLDTAVLTFAMMARDQGVQVLNPPESIVHTSHKGFVATLEGVPRPRTMVSRSPSALQAFAADMRDGVVVKPARASGGKGVSLVTADSPDLDLALDQARAIGDGYVVVQEYLAEAEAGERRLVWMDGRLMGGYLRRRAPGEFRHNLKRGGLPERCDPGPEEEALISAVTPHLERHGIWMAGVDVIGGRVVEVNTLNPGGLHLIQELSHLDLAPDIVSSLARRCRD